MLSSEPDESSEELCESSGSSSESVYGRVENKVVEPGSSTQKRTRIKPRKKIFDESEKLLDGFS